jgi:hypothetical protein
VLSSKTKLLQLSLEEENEEEEEDEDKEVSPNPIKSSLLFLSPHKLYHYEKHWIFSDIRLANVVV